MTTDLEELRTLAEKATGGVWLREDQAVYALNEYGTNRMYLQVQGGYVIDARTSERRERTTLEELAANAAYIAAANPATILALVSELEALREAGTDLIALLDDFMVVTSITANDRYSAALEKFRAALTKENSHV